MTQPQIADTAVSLAFETIRVLSQTAEACSLFCVERGFDVELVTLSVHCSDRAEHVAQYFLEASAESWPLKSLLDDVAWLIEVASTLDRVRVKVQRHMPTLDDLHTLNGRIQEQLQYAVEETATSAPNGPQRANNLPFMFPQQSPEMSAGHLKMARYGVKMVTVTQSIDDLLKAYPDKDVGYTLLTGGDRSEGDSLLGRIAALDGREFAMLSELELMQYRLARDAGRKLGVRVDILTDADPAELAASSKEQQEEIYRKARSKIAVSWALGDKGDD